MKETRRPYPYVNSVGQNRYIFIEHSDRIIVGDELEFFDWDGNLVGEGVASLVDPNFGRMRVVWTGDTPKLRPGYRINITKEA